MQILIIKLPAGEQISSLSYDIESGEVVIGQESSCFIRLPDSRQAVADRHARIYKESEQWFLEGIADNALTVNQTTVSSQRALLADGDLITLGEYQMVVSHFEPWLKTERPSIERPPLTSPEELAPEFCVIPDKNGAQSPGTMNDPFMEDISETGVDFTDLSMSHPEQSTEQFPDHQLIDVLAPQTEIDNDWSIHRALWSGDTEPLNEDLGKGPACSIPVLSDPVITPSNPHRKSICHAMLEALEQTLEDLSPQNLEERFQDYPTGRVRRFFSRKDSRTKDKKQRSGAGDYWQQYQDFHQQLMEDPSHRLLFLQRFRQAMKKQESH